MSETTRYITAFQPVIEIDDQGQIAVNFEDSYEATYDYEKSFIDPISPSDPAAERHVALLDSITLGSTPHEAPDPAMQLRRLADAIERQSEVVPPQITFDQEAHDGDGMGWTVESRGTESVVVARYRTWVEAVRAAYAFDG